MNNNSTLAPNMFIIKSNTVNTFKLTLRLIVLVGLMVMILTPRQSQAQQIPMYASYVVQPFLISPSFAGTGKESARLFGINRMQFVGIDGAPVTFMINGDAPIRNQNMGLGGSIFTDKFGLLRQTGFSLGYAYHLKLSDEVKLSLGLGWEISQYGLDFDNIVADDYSEDVLNMASANKLVFNGNFGLHLTYKDFVIGFSAPQLYGSRLVYSNYVTNKSVEVDMAQHYMGYMSYVIPVKENIFDLQPIVVMRGAAGASPQFDINLKGTFHKNFYLSLGFRSSYAATVGMGVNVSQNMMVGYSYDMSVNEISGYNSGSHEIILGYRFYSSGSKAIEEMVDEKQREERARLDSIFNSKMKEQNDKIKNVDEMNKMQQEEINRLQQIIKDYGIELDSVKKANALKLQNDINNGGGTETDGSTGGTGSGNGDGSGNGTGNPNNNSVLNGGGRNGSGTGSNNITGKYIVVVASFKDMENALEHQKMLVRKGDTQPTQIVQSKSGTWYFVYKQGFNDPTQAQTFLNSLSKDGLEEFMYPWIYVF